MEPSDGIPVRPEPRPNGAWARLPLGTRREVAELLDGGRLPTSDVAANLADLARLNRLPGGVAASAAGIGVLADGAAPTDLLILDVGTGRADLPLAFACRGWRSVAVDLNPQVLEIARRAAENEDAVEVVEADGRALPFANASFDVAHCSLLVHHLDGKEAVRLLNELRRVARRGVVVNDLRRGPFAFLATALPTLALSRSRVTRHDGIASARRAYTLDELDDLLAAAGLRTVWRSSRWLPRVATAAVAR
ncbi:MAG TPA: methyltransferase domain-containing protein [Candidatus Limnocylindria bacterium]|nr:methyltransferase domain-containing protein [Candidatus Limnocylindria bacterium]